MKLQIETWVESQAFDLESGSAFQESFICFKVGAYKAALLFAYLGFASVLRARILVAQPPSGYTAASWPPIQNNVRTAETWDKAVFESTQRNHPAPVFLIADDLRRQIDYWKNRRNDCAHSKQNKIVAAHVEAFYAFVESNLSKLAVNGSRPAMLAKISNFYNPSLTPPNQPIDPLIQEISHAVPNAELNDFITDLAAGFDNSRTAAEQLLDQESPNKLSFISKCFQLGTPELRSAWLNYLDAHVPCIISLLRSHSANVQFFNGRPLLVRRLWHDELFSDNKNDFPIFAALLRLNLIPAGEVNEAIAHVAAKPIGHVPIDIDDVTLRHAGFFNAFENVLRANLGQFAWANPTKALIVKHLSEAPITRNAAVAISQTFGAGNHPWHLRDALNEFFQNNAGKRQEYEAYLGGDPIVERPAHLTSLANMPAVAGAVP